MTPIAICHLCLRECGQLKPRDGALPCKIDGQDIRVHAKTGKCPINRFNLSPEELAKLNPTRKPAAGPGYELAEMFKLIIDDENCPSCPLRAAQMNEWKTAGCIEHRAEIIDWLTIAAKERGWLVKIEAGVRAAANGLPLTIGGLVDEAIRRAAVKEAGRE